MTKITPKKQDLSRVIIWNNDVLEHINMKIKH